MHKLSPPSRLAQVDAQLMGDLLVACRGPAVKSRGAGEGVLYGRQAPLGLTCQFECQNILLLAVFVKLFGLA